MSERIAWMLALVTVLVLAVFCLLTLRAPSPSYSVVETNLTLVDVQATEWGWTVTYIDSNEQMRSVPCRTEEARDRVLGRIGEE